MQAAALVFEFVPLDVFFCLNEVGDVKTRLNAISNLYCLTYDYVQGFTKVQSIRNRHKVKQLSENINYFLLFLQQLLEDSNFHVVITTLNIIQMLVENLPKAVLKQNREILVSTTLKLLGDQKNVIYQSIVDTCLLLLNVLPGRFVIDCLVDQATSEHTNVCQNALGVLKSLLLQISDSDLDHYELCRKLAPTVFDVNPQVRLFGLEFLVVLARHMEQRPENQTVAAKYSSFFEAFLQGVPVSAEQTDKTTAILCLQQRLAWYDLPCPVFQESILLPGQIPMTTQKGSLHRFEHVSRASLHRSFVVEDRTDQIAQETSYSHFPFATSLAANCRNSELLGGLKDRWGDQYQFSEAAFPRTPLTGTKKANQMSIRSKFPARIPWKGSHVPVPLPNKNSYLEQFAVQKQSHERMSCSTTEKPSKRCISFDLNTIGAPSTTRTDCRSPFLLVCSEEGNSGGGGGSAGFTLRPCKPPRIRARSKPPRTAMGAEAGLRRRDYLRADSRVAVSMDCEAETQKEKEGEFELSHTVQLGRRKARDTALKRWSSIDGLGLKGSLLPRFLGTWKAPMEKEEGEVKKEVEDLETSDEDPSALGGFPVQPGVTALAGLPDQAYEEPEVSPEELAHSVRTIRTSASQKRLNSILESGSTVGKCDENSSVSLLTASRIGFWAESFGGVDDTACDKLGPSERRKKDTQQSSGYSSATSKTNCEQFRQGKTSHESTARSIHEVKLCESPTRVNHFLPKQATELKPPRPIKLKKKAVSRSKISELSSNMDFMQIHVDCQPSDPPQVLFKLNSSTWDEQHRAIVCLLQATETSDGEDELANAWLQNWTDAQIQSLLQSLAVAVTNLRSQVSRAAIHLVRNLSHRLSNKPLETESFRLIPALLSRIGGDSSTAFIRTEAHDCLFVLIGKINPLCAVGCLNTAVNSGHGRSSMGRNAIAAALSAVLPSLVGLEGWHQPGGGPIEIIRTTTDLRGKRKEYFDRLLKNVAIFLADGNQETRQSGRSMLRTLIHIAGFENYCYHSLPERSWLTVKEALEKMGLRANPRLSSKARKLDPLQTTSVLKKSTSCTKPAPTFSVANFSNTAPVDNPVSSTVRKEDPGKRLRRLIANLTVPDIQEALKSLRQLGRKVAADKFDISSTDLEKLTVGISQLLSHSNEEIVLNAANFCIDARRLFGIRATAGNSNDVPVPADDLFTSGVNAPQKAEQKVEFDGEKFPPGLLALLFIHEDAEGFTRVMDILANHLACPYPGVASLAREACEMIRKILGPEALVKPLLHGQNLQEDPDKRAILIEELSDVTADLNAPSVLLDQYLVPEVLQLTSVAAQYTTSERLQTAMQSFVRCVYNQAGDTLLQAAKAADASETLETTLECA